MANNMRPVDMKRIATPERGKKVLLALSGGVDSSVVAALLIKAIGRQLVCVHVNHGLMRKGESEQVIEVFQNQLDANLIYVDATDRFLDLLAGVDEPERKRKIIGGEFTKVVKGQHNVGGLPDDFDFELVEPVRLLFKDEVRCVGRALGLPASMVERQPFPGPGLGVRCLGAITRARLAARRGLAIPHGGSGLPVHRRARRKTGL